MKAKNSLMVSALTLALGFGSSLVLADTTNTGAGGDQTATSGASGDNGAAAANENSLAVAIDDIDLSDNSDNSTNDSNNDNSDNSTNFADSFNVADSGNDNSDNSTNDSNNDNSDNSTNVADSFNITDSGNDNSDNSVKISDSGNTSDSGNVKVEDSFNTANYVVATTNNLAATVTDNYVQVGESATYRSVNRIGDGAFASLAGISQIAQSSGVGSVNQQQVSVQAELSLGGN